MYIYAFLLSFNYFYEYRAGNSLPFCLVLSCHGIRILCQMPLLLKVSHVQNDFLRIPSSSFLETVLIHLLDFITTEMRNSFLWVYIFRSRSKALIPRVTWYFLIDTLHLKKKIKSKQKRKYLNTQHAAILNIWRGVFFYHKVFIVDRLELIIIQYGTLFKLAIVRTSSIIWDNLIINCYDEYFLWNK